MSLGEILSLKGVRPLSMLTCYDYLTAQILAKTDIDIILVGDSVAQVVHGHPSTLPATLEMMALHTESVRRGAPEKFIVSDLPFGTFQISQEDATRAAVRLLKAGANAIKLEGCLGIEETIKHLVLMGIPVVGHLGLTPQSFNQIGYKVQGKTIESVRRLKEESLALEQLGASLVVLECLPTQLASDITQQLKIPTIGIGAGPGCDGQVLVITDLLGLSSGHQPKFVKNYADSLEWVTAAINAYIDEVRQQKFPSAEHSYGSTI